MDILEAIYNVSFLSTLECSYCNKDISKLEALSHSQYCKKQKSDVDHHQSIAFYFYKEFNDKLEKFILRLKIFRRSISNHSIPKQLENELKDFEFFSENLLNVFERSLKINKLTCQELQLIEKNVFLDQINFNFKNFLRTIKLSEIIRTKRRSIELICSNPTNIEFIYGFNYDVKFLTRNSQFTEDGHYLAIAECSKIMVFSIPNFEFLCRISDNRSPQIGLAGKLHFLIYQHRDYSLIIFNFRTKTVINQIKVNHENPVLLIKVSPNFAYFAAKFLSKKILFWDLTENTKFLSFPNIEDRNFIFMQDESKILLFDSTIYIYDFKQKIYVKEIEKNDLKIEFLVSIKDEILVYTDKKHLRILNMNDDSKSYLFSCNYQVFYLTKDLRYLCDSQNNVLKITKGMITNSFNYKEVLKNDIFGFVPVSSPFIYCDEIRQSRGKVTPTVIEYILKKTSIQANDNFYEKHIFTWNYIHKIVSNNSKLILYSWDLKNNNLMFTRDFSKEFKCRSFDDQYLILQDKKVNHFWNLETKDHDFYFFDQGYNAESKKFKEMKRFSFTLEKKFVVIPYPSKTIFNVYKSKLLNLAFKSEIMPFIDKVNGEIVTLNGNIVKNYDVVTHKLKYSLEIGECKLINFFKFQSLLYLFYNKKVKVINLVSNEKVTRLKLKQITDYKEVFLGFSNNHILLKTESILIVHSVMNGNLKSFSFEVGEAFEVLDFCCQIETNFLSVTYSLNMSKDHFQHIAIDLTQGNLISRQVSNSKFKPMIADDLLVILNSNTFNIIQISSNLIRAQIPLSSTCFQVLNQKYILMLNQDSYELFDVHDVNKVKKFKIEKDSEIKLTHDQKLLITFSSACLQVFDFNTTMLLFTKKFKTEKYLDFKLLDEDMLVVFNENMEFCILRINKGIKKVSKFVLHQDKWNEFVLSDNKKHVIIFGSESFAVVEIGRKIIIMKKILFKEFCRNRKYFVFIGVNQAITIMRIEDLQFFDVFLSPSKQITVDFKILDDRIVVFDHENTILYVKEMDYF